MPRGAYSDHRVPGLAAAIRRPPTGRIPRRLTPAAVAVWSRTDGRGPSHPALYDGGLAGTLVALSLGARVHPGLRTPAGRLGAHLAGRPPRYRTREVAFPDYDLISGPSGLLFALCATQPAQPVPRPDLDTRFFAAPLLPAVRRLRWDPLLDPVAVVPIPVQR